jgi:hypothetical protein
MVSWKWLFYSAHIHSVGWIVYLLCRGSLHGSDLLKPSWDVRFPVVYFHCIRAWKYVPHTTLVVRKCLHHMQGVPLSASLFTREHTTSTSSRLV